MSEHVSVRSNWTPADSLSLDLVCDVGFEEEEQSSVTDEPKEKNDVDDDNYRLVSCSYLRFSREKMTQVRVRRGGLENIGNLAKWTSASEAFFYDSNDDFLEQSDWSEYFQARDDVNETSCITLIWFLFDKGLLSNHSAAIPGGHWNRVNRFFVSRTWLIIDLPKLIGWVTVGLINEFPLSTHKQERINERLFVHSGVLSTLVSIDVNVTINLGFIVPFCWVHKRRELVYQLNEHPRYPFALFNNWVCSRDGKVRIQLLCVLTIVGEWLKNRHLSSRDDGRMDQFIWARQMIEKHQTWSEGDRVAPFHQRHTNSKEENRADLGRTSS